MQICILLYTDKVRPFSSAGVIRRERGPFAVSMYPLTTVIIFEPIVLMPVVKSGVSRLLALLLGVHLKVARKSETARLSPICLETRAIRQTISSVEKVQVGS